MLRLFRMYRFVRLVNRQNREIGFKDDFLVGFYADEDKKFVSKDECLQRFRVFSRNKTKRKYMAGRTCTSAIKNNFLTLHNKGGPVELLEVDAGKGEKLIEMFFIGFLRELIAQEWKFISLFFLIIGFVAGYVVKK